MPRHLPFNMPHDIAFHQLRALLQRAPALQHHKRLGPLPGLLVRHGDDGRVRHRLVRQQVRLQLRGRDLHPLHLDQLLDAVDNVQVLVAVGAPAEHPLVAGAHVPVHERLRRRLRVVQVSEHNAGRLSADLAGLVVARDLGAVGGDELDLVAGDEGADGAEGDVVVGGRGDDGACLGETVRLADGPVRVHGEELGGRGGAEWRCARVDAADVGEVVPAEGGGVVEHLNDDWGDLCFCVSRRGKLSLGVGNVRRRGC